MSLLLRGIAFFAIGARDGCRHLCQTPVTFSAGADNWMNANALSISNRFRGCAGNPIREVKMVKGSQLIGRAVIDIEAAERLGKIKQIIVQRDGERVAGFVVVHGETIVGTGGTWQMIPASAVYSIGPDAMTVRGSVMRQGLAELENLPRMSDII